MLELLLLRHAKSAWDEPGIADIDRPLASRGIEAAKAMGHFIAKNGLRPDRVLCSPACRTRSTWSLVAEAWPDPPPCEVIGSLYDFGDGRALLEAIRRHGGTSRRLMLVSHNPATEQFAARMATRGDAAAIARMTAKYPTAALAVFGIAAADWQAMPQTGGTLLRFVRPRDLPG